MFNQNLFVTKPFDFGEAEIHGSFKTMFEMRLETSERHGTQEA